MKETAIPPTARTNAPPACATLLTMAVNHLKTTSTPKSMAAVFLLEKTDLPSV